MMKFVHKPTEIIVQRFYNNNDEVDKFLTENNEIYCREYEWRFGKVKESPLLQIREYCPEGGVYRNTEVEHGDYIGRDEYGNITTYLQDEIEEFYDKVKE
nr:MAG TPA: hypothetical protein [Caudoviricetes sp.]